VTFSGVIDEALDATIDDISRGRFAPESEHDLQAMVYLHSRRLAALKGLADNRIHAEPPRTARGVKTEHPDLVLGDNEVFLQLKFIRSGATGEQMKVRHWVDDIESLKGFKAKWSSSRCIFFAIDEVHNHSNPRSKNYFEPSGNGLRGEWRPLIARARVLCADLEAL